MFNFYIQKRVNIKDDILSGLTVALALIPEAVAFSFVAGVEPLVGLYAAFIVGLITAGLLRLGKYISLVPHPVMLGFVNGLAIVILLSQLRHFKLPDEIGTSAWMNGTTLWIMIGLVSSTMAIIYFFPRLTRTVPAPLIAILVISAIVIGFNIIITL